MTPRFSSLRRTGASSGLGREADIQFSQQGAKVVLAARRQEALEETAKLCGGDAKNALSVVIDVTLETGCSAPSHSRIFPKLAPMSSIYHRGNWSPFWATAYQQSIASGWRNFVMVRACTKWIARLAAPFRGATLHVRERPLFTSPARLRKLRTPRRRHTRDACPSARLCYLCSRAFSTPRAHPQAST